jgi:hypothetical protein
LDVEDVIFKEGYILFVTDDAIRTFNPIERKFLLPIAKPVNSSISLYGDTLLFCEWENFQINNPDEYSTRILIYEKGKKENAQIVNLHPTVKPTNCSKDILYLKTSVSQLEKKSFSYYLESEKLEEIPIYQEEIVNSWMSVYEDIEVRKDIDNIIWVYRKVPKF